MMGIAEVSRPRPDAADSQQSPFVTGMPLKILRVEGLVLFSAALAAYFGALTAPFWLVPALLFLPDVSWSVTHGPAAPERGSTIAPTPTPPRHCSALLPSR
jgi:hypothetical protein